MPLRSLTFRGHPKRVCITERASQATLDRAAAVFDGLPAGSPVVPGVKNPSVAIARATGGLNTNKLRRAWVDMSAAWPREWRLRLASFMAHDIGTALKSYAAHDGASVVAPTRPPPEADVATEDRVAN